MAGYLIVAAIPIHCKTITCIAFKICNDMMTRLQWRLSIIGLLKWEGHVTDFMGLPLIMIISTASGALVVGGVRDIYIY